MSEQATIEHQHAHELVVVGSSAGGVGALAVLLGSLSADFPSPIVLAQHLDPTRHSNLAPILERRSKLPIVVVGDEQPMLLERGKVYVVPSNRHVVIQKDFVHLEGDHAGRPRPSIDLLLSSAAESYGERLIAVILTGSGSDGAAGAVDVKNAGGVVVIQNPQTASYPSMPMSLPPTAVDYIVDLEKIGALLLDLTKGIILPSQDKIEDPLRDLLKLVTRLSNIDFSNYKTPTILRRVARRMAVTHHATIREYEAFLESHPEEIHELVRTTLIKVTGFFRDPEAFEFLKADVLPGLIERNRPQGRSLRFWSAGSATGEEPYSVALLLADLLGPELPEWNIKIFATDLDKVAVNFARRGLYPANVLQHLPEEYLAKYFERVDQGYRISKTLRSLVIFGQQDLSRGVPFPRVDVAICRNLLIYLNPELQQKVLDLFAYSLYPNNGYLFLGKAETARPTKATFELVNKKWKIYRCLNGPVTLSPQQSGLDHRANTDYLERRSAQPRRVAPGDQNQGATLELRSASETELMQIRRFNERMLRYLPHGVVVIDKNYRIISLNGSARRLLSVRDMANEQDFLHTVRGLPYTQVRNAIDATFRDHSAASLNELELETSANGEARYISLTVMLMQVEAGATQLAVISVADATDHVQTRRRLEAVQVEQTQLVSELSSANKKLSDVNKEVQDTNEELQAANEELMLTQEELQATNEEFEATNEELQATNEELETNNEELQATNEELQTTNDELSARTNELQEMAKTLATDRIRLSEIVEQAPLYFLLLRGPRLIVESFNSSYERLLGGRMAIGRPFEELYSGGQMSEFGGIVRAAFDSNEKRVTDPMLTHIPEDHGEDAVGRNYVHTIAPLHDAEGNVDGVIIFTKDVTDS